ncbi:hypothetical protein DL768_005323 [Monosporascus sp. mg162]|nr:hypothetical protein DL768_005323 [Monosporascus sp. mg162]
MGSTVPSPPLRPATRDDFEVAIICALPLEANAVTKLFDPPVDKPGPPFDKYEDGPPFDKILNDPNAYTTGILGRHNVVVLHMGGMGKASAAIAAASCRLSFSKIKLAILVGICAAVPEPYPKSRGVEIILGDVIISTGVIQYDFGWETDDGPKTKEKALDSLGRPNPEIRGVLAQLGTDSAMSTLQDQMTKYMEKLGAKYPGKQEDRFFRVEDVHKEGGSCKNCGTPLPRKRIPKNMNGDPKLKVHLGLVGTGDKVIRSAKQRDKIAEEKEVIAFEMEGAGVWDAFPSACIVIKAACDYADSHKHKGWQPYAAARAAACMKAFLRFFPPSRPAPVPPYVPPSEPQFRVPRPENDRFVGRTDILKKLKELFRFSNQTKVSLVGIGGIGKTLIALRYANACWEERRGFSIFWVNAGNAQQFQQSYASIAKDFRVPGYIDPKEDVRHLVRDWLDKDKTRQWLMILDNADDATLFSPQNLGRFIPACAHVSVLVTTRNEAGLGLPGEKTPIPVPKMEYGDVSQLFPGDTKGTTQGINDLDTLVTQLEGLPLALAQAAGFIRDQRVTISEYLELLKGSEKNLRDLLGGQCLAGNSGALHAATRTWFLSFEKAREKNSTAGEILSFMSCLDAQPVPPGLISRYTKPPNGNKPDVDPVAVLRSLSLVSQDVEGGLDMTRPVRSLIQKWLAKKEKIHQFEAQAVVAVSQAYPAGNAENRARCTGLLGHAATVLRFQDKDLCKDAQLAKATLLCSAASFCVFQGQWKDAEEFYGKALTLLEKGLVVAHPLTLKGKCGLAGLYRKQGKWALAYEHEKAVMDARTSKAGSEMSLILANLANVASTLAAQGKWDEAEKMEVKVVKGRQTSAGDEHPSTLASMSRLAATYRKRGKWGEAEKLEKYVMSTREKIWGERDPLTLASMSSLSATYRKQGRWEEAEGLELRAMEKSRQVLGDEDLTTLASMANLASIFGARGRWRDAISLEVKVSQMRARVLGEGHALTLATMSGLASTCWKAGYWEDAMKLEEEVITRRERVLGAADPLTLASNSDLASMYRKQGMWVKAEELETKVMITFEREFRGNLGYPAIKNSMDLFVSAQRGQGSQQQMMDPVKQCIKLWQQVLVGNDVWERRQGKEVVGALSKGRGRAGRNTRNSSVAFEETRAGIPDTPPATPLRDDQAPPPYSSPVA